MLTLLRLSSTDGGMTGSPRSGCLMLGLSVPGLVQMALL